MRTEDLDVDLDLAGDGLVTTLITYVQNYIASNCDVYVNTNVNLNNEIMLL